MGCGRVGSSLAASLDRLGHEVAVIDKDGRPSAGSPPISPGARSSARAFTGKYWSRPGVERAQAFAAVSSGDNSNIIAARVARETFGIARVVARIYDAKRAAVYERLGIPTVATVPWSTDRLMRMLLPDGVASAWREPTGTVAILPLPVHEEWVGPPGPRAGGGHRVPRGVHRPLRHRRAAATPETFVQAEDTIYVAAVSGTVSDVTSRRPRPRRPGGLSSARRDRGSGGRRAAPSPWSWWTTSTR